MAEKKKILYIVEAMGGGVFTYIVDLANELVNKYDMYIAYAVRKQTPKNYKDYFDKRIHLIEVKNFRRAIDPMKDIAAFFEVKKIAAEIKPDIIHLHSSKAGAIGRMAFNGKIPMFYCGACERVCPIIHTAKEKPFEQAAYIVQNKDQKVLRESTAGGAFTAIAKYVLHNNGVVVGVELGADLTARHVAVEKENDLYRFRNSKYVQSSVGGYPPTD